MVTTPRRSIARSKCSDRARQIHDRRPQQDRPVGLLWFRENLKERDLHSSQTLWTAYKEEVERNAQKLGVLAPDLGDLSQYRHSFRIGKEVRPVAGVPLLVTVAQIAIIPRDAEALTPQTEARFIQQQQSHQRIRGAVVDGVQLPPRLILRESWPVRMKRGALDTFFKPAAPKKPRYEASVYNSNHASYPFAIPYLPAPFTEQLGFAPSEEGKLMNDQLDLDLIYYQPYIPSSIAGGVFEFLRHELPFYRVQYNITRGGIQTQINTPRFTTVFGVDESSRFAPDGSLVDAKSGNKIEASRYKCKPRPIPQCLDELRKMTEGTTGETFNFCLVNYYADGKDSISYHSDDERFLGPNPAIASFSLGAKRDFLMKHKPIPPKAGEVIEEPKPIKVALGSGDMVLMRGKMQANWLHSIPKRAGPEAGRGRINITFRRATIKGGTENYYQYNVGVGGVYKWDTKQEKMVPWDEAAVKVEASGSANGAV